MANVLQVLGMILIAIGVAFRFGADWGAIAGGVEAVVVGVALEREKRRTA